MSHDSSTRPGFRCFNVKYSPNLGDGLLSECLEHALVELGADPRSHSIDLAAREQFGDVMAGRGAIMKALDMMPGPLRKLAVRAPLALHARMKWQPHYAAGLEGADAVVVGGGNLLADLDLNFPTKLSLAVDQAAERGLPLAIYGCGMSSGWSKTALKWCRRSFAQSNVKAVFLRDAASKAIWDELMGDATGHEAQIVRDPGLLATYRYPAPARTSGERPVAGLNIMSPIAIRYHATGAPTQERLTKWYLDVARLLVAEGYEVHAFTNGSPEDRDYFSELQPQLRAIAMERDIAFLDQRDPTGLCAHLAGFDALIAYRMHAVIGAYSYRVPTVALRWDRKLDSFMQSVGLEDWMLDVATGSPEDCVALLQQAQAQGISPERHAEVLTEARDGVAQLWPKLTDFPHSAARQSEVVNG